jgi:hypothetical protein
MRFLPLAALLFFIPLSAGAQDACTADFGTHIGSPACPYQWVGATTVRFDGSGQFELNGGVRVGFVGMTSQCRAEFGPGARMCRSGDILSSDTLNLNGIPQNGCWIAPSLVGGNYGYQLDATGGAVEGQFNTSGNTKTTLSCDGWRLGGSPYRGMSLLENGSFYASECATYRAVACCKPQPVPAPTSSLMLPIGVSGLAALSLIKNAS